MREERQGRLRERFCPVCGRRVTKYYEGLCEECYRKLHPLLRLPSTLRVTICRVCGAYKLGSGWAKPRGPDPLLQAVKAALKRAAKPQGLVESMRVASFDGLRLRVVARGRAAEGMEPYEEEYECRVKVEWGLCEECIYAKSKREVARIQVRARGRDLSGWEVRKVKELVTNALSSTWRGAIDLVEVIEDGHGLDFIFSSLAAAKLAVSALERGMVVHVLETRKSMGVDSSGKPRARSTFRVLLPEFRVGDVIEHGGRLFYVMGFEERCVKALELNTLREVRIRATRRLLEESNVVVRREGGEPVMIISARPGEIQVMSLRDYHTYSIYSERIPLWVEEGGKAMLFSIKGRYYVLPTPPTTG
ncbi:MAG: hypothetical protein DRK00_01390 [Thermoprotei archaeon]|nr:MAG: hypothetical protein DRK00_01390 [Thermoprotei archaeon]HDD33960.1 hypothetical protein [Thermofilaceae archaeon]